MNLLYRDCNQCNDRALHDNDTCLVCKYHNEAIETALKVIGQRLETIEALDEESDKIAGLTTAYAMLRGLLK